ncbi:carboxymethylenebutenolidase [Trichosporon asahii var. asahii CBS 8904]|uniref:Carboxymethylenebutenolidase n=1 Tax=Trichosporon asahii var. asahii (strain CBS 8904) TaxID=1220162 RepID=K1WQT2_TRIAC|nr:carboxymethylenebutenolidase [Trichosporon asahii var. asahii CBS 8904]
MLIKTSYRDVETKADGCPGKMRIFVIEPNVPEYPEAKFPGCVVFSEIYQVTGPVERFASNIASEGYVVALPSSFHEFEGPEPIPYDTEGTDRGNRYKVSYISRSEADCQIEKTVEAYDEQCAFDPRVLSTFCYFATDVHSATLGKGKKDDTLVRVKKGDLTGKGEVTLVFGKQDTHVDRAGRTLIRDTLDDAGVTLSAQHAFIRDESSKGRWDAALSRSLFAMMMESFTRCVARDLGKRVPTGGKVEHVC